jgi:hypothetical protein
VTGETPAPRFDEEPDRKIGLFGALGVRTAP